MKYDVHLSKCDPTLNGREYHLDSPIYAKELRVLVDIYTQKLSRKGVESAYNDVLELLSWFLEITRAELQAKIAQKTPIRDAFSGEQVDGSQLNDYADNQVQSGIQSPAQNLMQNHAQNYARAVSQMDFLIDQRAKRIPLQQITQVAYFYGLELEVGKGVYTPRPETETLVSHSLVLLEGMQISSPRILDLCAGSGAIALAIAANTQGADIIAVEKEASAYAYLERNVAAQESAFKSSSKVRAVLGDALKLPVALLTSRDSNASGTIKEHGTEGHATREPAAELTTNGRSRKCNLITCNPPYVPSAQRDTLSPEVRRDPAAALFGDDATSTDGFALPAKIITAAVSLLDDGGAMIVEHAEHQSALAKTAFEAAGKANGVRFSEIYHLDDLNLRPRFTIAKVTL